MQTVFIVDSDAVLLTRYADAIAREERQIVKFRTADLAVKALGQHIPDYVVLELALPGHNGFEFLYELRSYADTRKTKIIIHSLMKESSINWSYVTKEDFGIVAYLYKPETTLDALCASLERV